MSKTVHLIVIVLAIVGGFAVLHMYQHHGMRMEDVPGLGSK